jgi:ERCC4-type nuclease
MEQKPELEKSIQEQILNKMISKLKEKNSFEDEFLKELKKIDLTKAPAVKEILTKSFKKDEDSETGN